MKALKRVLVDPEKSLSFPKSYKRLLISTHEELLLCSSQTYARDSQATKPLLRTIPSKYIAFSVDIARALFKNNVADRFMHWCHLLRS